MINWKSKVSKEDIDSYKEIDKVIDEVTSDLSGYSEDELRTIVTVVSKLKSEQLKIVYKYDFKKFVDDLFTNAGDASLQDKCPTPEFHIEMYNAYQNNDRVAIICPRGFAKSSTARIFMLHQILYKKRKYIITLGSSEDMASQNLRWVRDQLTDNPKIIEIYGVLYNKKKWAETEFVTSTNIKVVAKGAGQKIRGMNEKGRPDLILIDDLEDDEMVANKESRAKTMKWFKEAVMPIKSKEAKIIYIGTILDNDSLLKNVSKNLVRDHIQWKVLFFQAVYTIDNGKKVSLWEEHRPLSELLSIQENDPETFAKEYQNDPRAGMMALFKQEWFTDCHYAKEELIEVNGNYSIHGKKLTLLCTTDFAVSSKEGADYSVILVSGITETGYIYVLDYHRWRTSDPYEMITMLFTMCEKWGCDMYTVETVAFQNTFNRTIEKEMESKGIILTPIEMQRKNVQKLQRLKGIIPNIRLGKIKWTIEQAYDIEDELLQCTALKTGNHDDILDCLIDSNEVHVEGLLGDIEETKEVNTIQWAIDQGYLPTIEEENL